MLLCPPSLLQPHIFTSHNHQPGCASIRAPLGNRLPCLSPFTRHPYPSHHPIFHEPMTHAAIHCLHISIIATPLTNAIHKTPQEHHHHPQPSPPSQSINHTHTNHPTPSTMAAAQIDVVACPPNRRTFNPDGSRIREQTPEEAAAEEEILEKGRKRWGDRCIADSPLVKPFLLALMLCMVSGVSFFSLPGLCVAMIAFACVNFWQGIEFWKGRGKWADSLLLSRSLFFLIFFLITGLDPFSNGGVCAAMIMWAGVNIWPEIVWWERGREMK